MSETSDSTNPSGIKVLVQKYKGQIGIGLLVLYVFLLGLGTVGEIWEIEWILDLPLFRPPGKY
ncbi:MAG: hypothetical protein HN472_06770 [Nitrospina sp.]|jgi:hypothetical protein|nr:hypothetical protein [Nitrospina sp.]MBT3509233.1 hypothetical protein [Nitrospina sp.]MBT3877184.1 hypothetical protein [Nitrospina sp.]MBT4048097.1 hypothetical protein [Nitrospina sp.]MBT4559197.1 hypothetical protein [Nitrospina sp.]